MRYWRLISVVTVAVLGIGVFYMYGAIAGNQYPAFGLEKKQGDAKEIKNVVLEADYQLGSGGDNLQITADGSVFFSDYSYFERLKGINDPPFIKRIQRDYKNFLRGKYTDQSRWYEDEKMLAYADVDIKRENKSNSELTFKIDVLNKTSDDRQSFKINLPNEGYGFVDVQDIRLQDGELIVLSQNYGRESENTGIHAYWIDLDKQEIMKQETVFPASENEDKNWSDAYLINSNDAVDDYIILQVDYDYYVEPDEEQAYAEPPLSELMVYNLETNELEKLELPKEIDEVIQSVTLHDSKLYFKKETKDSLEIFSYDLEDKKLKDQHTIEISNASEEQETLLKIDNGKLYVSGRLNDKSSVDLVVVDLESGDTLYEGTVEAKDRDLSEQEVEELYVFDIILNDK